MKSKDQQLLEEAYEQILKEGQPDDPRLNKADVSNRPVADYSEPKDYVNDLRNRERNAGVEEERPKRTASSGSKLGDVYTKHGRDFIIARSKYSNKLEPHSTTLVRGEDLEDGRYEVEYKITGVDEKGYPIEEPTGKKIKMRPPTQWGVENVPGGDID